MRLCMFPETTGYQKNFIYILLYRDSLLHI